MHGRGTAEEAYADALRRSQALSRVIRAPMLDQEAERAAILGQNVLREEIGYFGPYEGSQYDLDKETSDGLLAHARQDIAGVYSLASYALNHAGNAERIARQNRALLIATLVALLAVGAKVWTLA